MNVLKSMEVVHKKDTSTFHLRWQHGIGPSKCLQPAANKVLSPRSGTRESTFPADHSHREGNDLSVEIHDNLSSCCFLFKLFQQRFHALRTRLVTQCARSASGQREKSVVRGSPPIRRNGYLNADPKLLTARLKDCTHSAEHDTRFALLPRKPLRACNACNACATERMRNTPWQSR